MDLGRVFVLWACATALMGGCGPAEDQTGQRLQETWDAFNAPSKMDLPRLRYDELIHPDAKNGVMRNKPWRDSYWPFAKTGLARRYVSKRDFDSAGAQIKAAKNSPESPLLSPAEKYDLISPGEKFSLTRESWGLYRTYTERYPDKLGDWRWMGACSGWAPAAIMEKPPLHHVVARPAEGPEVLFFKGDMRALMTKAYDMNELEGGYTSIGSRCNEKRGTVRRSSSGRPVDGTLEGMGGTFRIVEDHLVRHGIAKIRFHSDGHTAWVAAGRKLRKLSKPVDVFLYSSQQNLMADWREEKLGRRATYGEKRSLRFYKNCRDVNPATLHLGLVELLSSHGGKRTGFVLESERLREVWNYPIWGFEANIGPLKRVSADQVGLQEFRASRAEYVATVETRLAFVPLAAQPHTAYHDHRSREYDYFEQLSRSAVEPDFMALTYTLEFDADGFLIGGEWDQSKEGDQPIPDFFWRPNGRPTDKDADGGASPIKFSRLEELLKCSRKEPDRTVTYKHGGEKRTIDAITCSLD